MVLPLWFCPGVEGEIEHGQNQGQKGVRPVLTRGSGETKRKPGFADVSPRLQGDKGAAFLGRVRIRRIDLEEMPRIVAISPTVWPWA
jgi:hypothetical protein